MSAASEDVVHGIYNAFARGDIAAILNALDQQIEWRVPDNLPHGGTFSGRDQVGRFFQGIGEHWETLTVDIGETFSSDDRVVVLAHIHGKLRSTGEEDGYDAAHAWSFRDGNIVRFAETVDAPLTLPAAVHSARGS